jgi:cytidylate kinase
MTISEQVGSGVSPQGFVVAIDGPAGAGKSTVASYLAKRFGLLNLETGAMYRALALKTLRCGIAVDDADAILLLTRSTRIALEPGDTGNRVLLDGAEVTGELRTPEITAAASRVSVHGPVREWMVEAQRALGNASPSGVVMEGRDIGTVVFPAAPVKIFLDASVEARGDRRFAQQPASAETKETLLREMQDRDMRDRSREQSPLKPASDAIILDTSGLSLDQVLERTEALVSAKLPKAS